MAEGLILEFEGVGRGLYDAVNEKLGVDTTNPTGDWPAGLLFHAAGETDGGLAVFEVWESKDAQDRFMNERLGPALGASDAPRPARMEWIALIAHTSVGAASG